jgi:hypothetical protein
MIEIVSSTEFRLTRGQHRMTLRKQTWGSWEMYTDNVAARAYNHGFPGVHTFRTLEEVERRYKSWRGIAALVASFDPLAVTP